MQAIDDIYENLEEYSQTKKRGVLIAFDDMIADMKSNDKLSNIVAKSVLREKKVNASLVFILQSYFKVHKTIRLIPAHYCFFKASNKR